MFVSNEYNWGGINNSTPSFPEKHIRHRHPDFPIIQVSHDLLCFYGFPQHSTPHPSLSREITLSNLRLLRPRTTSMRRVLRTTLRSRLSNSNIKVPTELARISKRRLFLGWFTGALDTAAYCTDEGGVFADAGRVHGALCWEAGDAGLLGGS